MPERAKDDEDISTTLRNLEAPPHGEDKDAEASSEAKTKKRVGRSGDSVAHGSDTLLSAPATSEEEPSVITDRDNVRHDDRRSEHVEEVERRVDQLEARVHVLEMREPSTTPRWLIWVLFLFGLALAFQLSRQI